MILFGFHSGDKFLKTTKIAMQATLCICDCKQFGGSLTSLRQVLSSGDMLEHNSCLVKWCSTNGTDLLHFNSSAN